MVVFQQTLFLNWKLKKVSKISVPIDSQNGWKLDVLDSWALMGLKMVDLHLDGIPGLRGTFGSLRVFLT